jgi:redox-regulated HSP33 family molecular chaperone
VPLCALCGKKTHHGEHRETQRENLADTVSIEKRIDELVYKLYELTEEEVRIIEESPK